MTDRELMQQAVEALEAWNYLENPKPDANVIAALRAAIEQAQEPVAWMYDLKQRGSFEGVSTEYSRVKLSIGENWVPLYTTPPQRKPLTDEEIERACVPLGAAMLSFTEVARAIEAAHGIKGKA